MGKNTRVYVVEPNDCHWMCQCPNCSAFSEREGADSGPLIDLLNALADGIKDEYPDVLVGTFAYSNNITSPKTVRPRGNVMIRLAQLNAEWAMFLPIDRQRRQALMPAMPVCRWAKTPWKMPLLSTAMPGQLWPSFALMPPKPRRTGAENCFVRRPYVTA